MEKIPNYKQQKTNKSQIPMTKITNKINTISRERVMNKVWNLGFGI
jgi:hypothetical protein